MKTRKTATDIERFSPIAARNILFFSYDGLIKTGGGLLKPAAFTTVQ